ncbi:hypothetical protein D6833_02945 [Candidatus Parcubacteria bacterium]|nr:MAG: hypothetical protein D6833_02945 [Candidatus Parcubacteria bacterium]
MKEIEERVEDLKEIVREIILSTDVVRDPEVVETLKEAYNTLRWYSDKIAKQYGDERKALLAELEPYKDLRDLAKSVAGLVKEAVSHAAVQAYHATGLKKQGDVTVRVKRKVRVINPDVVAKHLDGFTFNGRNIVNWVPEIDEEALLGWWDYVYETGEDIPEDLAKSFEVYDDYVVAVAKSDIEVDTDNFAELLDQIKARVEGLAREEA